MKQHGTKRRKMAEFLVGAQKAGVTTATPLWPYILREAEFHGGLLNPLGG